jgi:hypothetical protein
MQNKTKTFAKFKKFKQQIKVETNKNKKLFMFNRGGEFTSTKFNNYCNEHGIQQ